MSLWQHLFPPFDAWWPNIVAAVLWASPAFVVSHLVHRKHADTRHRQLLTEIRRHCDSPTCDHQSDAGEQPVNTLGS